MGPDPLNTADSNGSQPYREPFNADPYLPDAVADTPRGPVAGSKDDPLGTYPLRLLKKEAVDRKPAESAVLPKIVLPKGYTLDAPADAKASKAGTKPSPVKAFTGDEAEKAESGKASRARSYLQREGRRLIPHAARNSAGIHGHLAAGHGSL